MILTFFALQLCPLASLKSLPDWNPKRQNENAKERTLSPETGVLAKGWGDRANFWQNPGFSNSGDRTSADWGGAIDL